MDPGTKDGDGCADHDTPNPWAGARLTTAQHMPFSERDYLRLLMLRSRAEARGQTAARREERGESVV